MSDESRVVAGLIGGALLGGGIMGFGSDLGPIGCIVGAIIGAIITVRD